MKRIDGHVPIGSTLLVAGICRLGTRHSLLLGLFGEGDARCELRLSQAHRGF